MQHFSIDSLVKFWYVPWWQLMHQIEEINVNDDNHFTDYTSHVILLFIPEVRKLELLLLLDFLCFCAKIKGWVVFIKNKFYILEWEWWEKFQIDINIKWTEWNYLEKSSLNCMRQSMLIPYKCGKYLFFIDDVYDKPEKAHPLNQYSFGLIHRQSIM